MLHCNRNIYILLTNKLKYALWYIFKAPQRKISSASIINDLRGIIHYYFRSFRKKSNHKISICIGTYNRSSQLLNHVLPAINALHDKHNIELSIYDTGSDDVDDLAVEIRKRWKGALVFNSAKEVFTRARTLNKAVEQCTGNVIFLCDADISFPSDLLNIIQQIIRPGVAWFPICFASAPPNSKQTGKWLWYSAKGLAICMKDDFFKIGRLNEKYTTWGGEDGDLWERFYENKFIVIRQKLRGLIHHYHTPESGASDYFKD